VTNGSALTRRRGGPAQSSIAEHPRVRVFFSVSLLSIVETIDFRSGSYGEIHLISLEQINHAGGFSPRNIRRVIQRVLLLFLPARLVKLKLFPGERERERERERESKVVAHIQVSCVYLDYLRAPLDGAGAKRCGNLRYKNGGMDSIGT